jgi:hypothetical protein
VDTGFETFKIIDKFMVFIQDMSLLALVCPQFCNGFDFCGIDIRFEMGETDGMWFMGPFIPDYRSITDIVFFTGPQFIRIEYHGIPHNLVIQPFLGVRVT